MILTDARTDDVTDITVARATVRGCEVVAQMFM
ncbi:protein of unknown function [Burkholderia multivorans]